MTLARTLALLVLTLASTTPVAAETIQHGSLEITQAWTRATPGTAKVGAGYLTIKNSGAEPDTLVSATAGISKKTELPHHDDGERRYANAGNCAMVL